MTQPNNKNWREEIEKIVAVHYGAGVMIATMEGRCTDGVIDLRDKMTKELQDFIASERKLAQEEERESLKNNIVKIINQTEVFYGNPKQEKMMYYDDVLKILDVLGINLTTNEETK